MGCVGIVHRRGHVSHQIRGVRHMARRRLLDLIDQRLHELDLTRNDVARKTGLSKNWIYEYAAERGFETKRATADVVDKLVSGLGLNREAAMRAAAQDAGYAIETLTDGDVVVLASVRPDATPEEREQALRTALEGLRSEQDDEDTD